MYSREIELLLKRKRIKPGDRIRVIKGKQIYEGYLLPRIELGDKNCIIIKLDNGYNIGIRFEKGVKIEKVKGRRKLEVFPKLEIKQREDLPGIALIATGGTIASRVDYLTGGVKMAMKPEEILFAVPKLRDLVSFVELRSPFCLASEDMCYEHWQEMARMAAKLLNKKSVRGVVITHGTDTMHYSAAALSFMLRSLNKPVVFTGAQRSSDRGSSDASMNLTCACIISAYSDIAEVGICMHATSSDDYCHFIRGTRARKMHTSRRDAFRSVNEKPLARVWPNKRIEIINENHRKRSDRKVKVDAKFEPRVALLKAFPGSDPRIIDKLVELGMRGIVIEGTGLGHVPTSTPRKKLSWAPHIKEAIERGVTIAMTSQCIYGRVHPYVYRNLRIISQLGVIYCEDMLPEVAYVKLGWVLGHTKSKRKIRELMLRNLAGELSKRSDYDTFLI